MFDQVHNFIIDYNIGDYSSIFGILITIIGFGITLFQVLKTKSASVYAKDSINEFKHEVMKFKTVSDLSEIVAIMSEIKELNRQKQWNLLIFRYDDLKKRLIEVETSNLDWINFRYKK